MIARRVLGMMSGTSLDGVDAAILTTDGVSVAAYGASLARPFDDATRRLLQRACAAAVAGRDDDPAIGEAERALTDVHIAAARDLAAMDGPVDLVGFHGQTILHRPAPGRPGEGRTWQIGEGERLSEALGVPVVVDFRSDDVAAGGEGAPLAPVYHWALASSSPKPGAVAVLNLGGVANLTFVPSDRDVTRLVAFDTGPASGLLDQWMEARAGLRMDEDGRVARSGRVDEAALASLLAHPYFNRPPPKSLDRYDFSTEAVSGLSIEDGAATLTEFTARSIVFGISFSPEAPMRIIVCGGGRRNGFLMERIRDAAGVPVIPAEDVGWRGDVLEAECFAYLAARSVRKLPLSFSGTTGVAGPTTGGRVVGL